MFFHAPGSLGHHFCSQPLWQRSRCIFAVSYDECSFGQPFGCQRIHWHAWRHIVCIQRCWLFYQYQCDTLQLQYHVRSQAFVWGQNIHSASPERIAHTFSWSVLKLYLASVGAGVSDVSHRLTFEHELLSAFLVGPFITTASVVTSKRSKAAKRQSFFSSPQKHKAHKKLPKAQNTSINPAYNPNSKVSRFIPLTPIWYWQASEFSQTNIKCHSLNTWKTAPRNTAKTPQKHHQGMSKTPKTSPNNTVKTLRTHHQRATRTPTTTETHLRDHQDTSRTDTEKLLPTYFVRIVFLTITIFSHHHHHNNNDNNTTTSSQHHPLFLHHYILCHQPSSSSSAAAATSSSSSSPTILILHIRRWAWSSLTHLQNVMGFITQV